MKPRNFPARKLMRKIRAAKRDAREPFTDSEQSAITEARMIRTKKRRAS